jgi:predicted HicB family RNase H-like nuclease
MRKKVTITPRPKKSEEEIMQSFVDGKPLESNKEQSKEKEHIESSRLTVTIPKSLHKKLKFKSFELEKNLADLVIEILEKNL